MKNVRLIRIDYFLNFFIRFDLTTWCRRRHNFNDDDDGNNDKAVACDDNFNGLYWKKNTIRIIAQLFFLSSFCSKNIFFVILKTFFYFEAIRIFFKNESDIVTF